MSEVILDITRLLSRVLHPTPTGVDRVEMAYAQGLLRRMPDTLSFSVTHPSGVHGRALKSAAVEFIGLTAERWEDGGASETRTWRWRRAAGACLSLAPWPRPAEPRQRPAAYMHLSPRSLERGRMVRAILRRERARFIPFVHDLIPLAHPEYDRPRAAALLRR